MATPGKKRLLSYNRHARLATLNIMGGISYGKIRLKLYTVK